MTIHAWVGRVCRGNQGILVGVYLHPVIRGSLIVAVHVPKGVSLNYESRNCDDYGRMEHGFQAEMNIVVLVLLLQGKG